MTIEYKNRISYSLNPDKDEIMVVIGDAMLKSLRGFLTEDDNLYLWDADLWVHNEIIRRLGINGIRFNIGYLDSRDSYVIVSRSDKDKIKLLASPKVQATGLEVL